MKLVTFQIQTPIGPHTRLGALLDGDQDGRIVDLTTAFADWLATETDEPTPAELANLRTPPDMVGWLRGAHESRKAAERAVAHARRLAADDIEVRSGTGARLVFARPEIRLMAPLPRPNSARDFSTYLDHMSNWKTGGKPIDWYSTPPYYKGNPDTFIGPDDPIPYPYYTKRLDIEVEIGIVIGRAGRNLTFGQASDCIAGYTIWVDPSCRDGRGREPFGPTKRKDFCTALGPCLVTADEIDEDNLDVRVSVDGEVWFEGNTGAPRSFAPPQLVAYVSDNEPLFPGDVIGGGTIGLGCAMDYDRWIEVGQTITLEVQGIGYMKHLIVPGEHVVDHVTGMKGLLTPPNADEATA